MQSNNRAKQFLPFDAFKGFQEALRMADIEVEERNLLDIDFLENLNRKVCSLKAGEYITNKVLFRNRLY